MAQNIGFCMDFGRFYQQIPVHQNGLFAVLAYEGQNGHQNAGEQQQMRVEDGNGRWGADQTLLNFGTQRFKGQQGG